MKRVFRWLIFLPVALVAVTLAVNNRGLVSLDLWPLPFEISAPFILFILTGMVLGIVAGGLSAWFSAAPVRARGRAAARRAEALERENQKLCQKLCKAATDRAGGIKAAAPGQLRPPADAA